MVIALSMTAGAQTQIKEHRRSITLDEAIVIARTQSVDAAVALNELKTAYWEYRTFRANLLPEMNLKATLPSYNKKYNSYQQEDGTYTYVRNNNLQMSGELSIDQSIWFTGGTLSLNSSLDFLKQLDGDKSKRYMSVPIALTLNQPIFGVNNIKWDRRIEPVRYAEAKASFLSARHDLPDFCVRIVPEGQFLQVVEDVVAHIRFQLAAHDMPDGLHVVVRRRVDDAQQHVDAAHHQHERHRQRRDVVGRAGRNCADNQRQHQLADGRQRCAAQVERHGLAVLAEVGEEAPDKDAGTEGIAVLLLCHTKKLLFVDSKPLYHEQKPVSSGFVPEGICAHPPRICAYLAKQRFFAEND